jgi:RNA recognition motif-containing protein
LKEEKIMGKDLYVGNISFKATEEDILKLFSVAGRVKSIHLIKDPKTGQFKGCGFVKMADVEAKKAIATLDGTLLVDRVIEVSEARPQKPVEQRNAGPRENRGQGRGPAGRRK